MAPVFDPIEQNENIDSKIIAGLERISRVFRLLLWDIAKDENLSPIQIQFLIFLLYNKPSRRRMWFDWSQFLWWVTIKLK